MKDTLKRLNRLESLISQEVTIPLIAIQDEAGIHWLDSIYPDEKSFDRAAQEILGDNRDKPLIIITLQSKKLDKNSEPV